MRLDEAIELLDTAKEGWPAGDNSEEYYKALELGIEALKREEECRHNLPLEACELLPGETEV